MTFAQLGPDRWQTMAAVGLLQLLPAAAIATLVMQLPGFQAVTPYLALVKDTKLGRDIAMLSEQDVQLIIARAEALPEAVGYQNLLTWAKTNPTKAREVVRAIAEQTGLAPLATSRGRRQLKWRGGVLG